MDGPADLTSSEAGEEWRSGLRVGNYTLGRRLGVGGMAEVFEGRHVTLHHRVAVKRLLPKFAERSDVVARFLREGRAAAAVRHPHVVTIFDVGVWRDAPYLVMEFLEGEDLERHLRARGPLEVVAAVDLMLPVLSAVRAAHDAGLIHRDLKPANIVLARDQARHPRPVVVDFGVARGGALVDGVVTADEALVGTPAYLSPEQYRAASLVSPASDQYALGVILYEALTGRLPFDAPTLPALIHAVLAGEFTPPRALRPELPAALDAVLCRALATDPAARFADVSALLDALLPFASQRARYLWSAVAPDAPPPESAPDAPTSPDDLTATEPALVPTLLPAVIPPAPVTSPPRAPRRATQAILFALTSCALLALAAWRSSAGTQPLRRGGAPQPVASSSRDDASSSRRPASVPPSVAAHSMASAAPSVAAVAPSVAAVAPSVAVPAPSVAPSVPVPSPTMRHDHRDARRRNRDCYGPNGVNLCL